MEESTNTYTYMYIYIILYIYIHIPTTSYICTKNVAERKMIEGSGILLRAKYPTGRNADRRSLLGEGQKKRERAARVPHHDQCK